MIKLKKIDYFLDFLLFFSLVFQDVYKVNVFGTPLYKYCILAILGLLIIDYYIKKKPLKINILYISILICLYLYSYFVNFNFNLIVPSIFLIIEVCTFSLYIKKYENQNEIEQHFFKVILYASIFVSIIGIIQLISFKLNLPFIYKNITQFEFYLHEGRLTSIYSEPAHLCALLGGGAFISLHYFVLKKEIKFIFMFFLLLITTILSGSIVTYLSVFLFLIFLIIYYFLNNGIKIKNKKNFKVILLFLIIILGVFGIFNSKNDFLSTVNRKIEFLNNNFGMYSKTEDYDHITSIQMVNSSSYAIKSNLEICKVKMLDGYVFGTGIFSHQNFYDKYMTTIFPSGYYRINYIDACSMFLRIFSEFGIIGFVIYMLLLGKVLIKGFREKNIFLIFILATFLTQTMRLGDYNYILACFPFVYILSNIKIYFQKMLVIDIEKRRISFEN